jgi:Zn-dependent membrane protease YugP
MISSTTLIWIVMGAVMLLSLLVQNRLNSRFAKYSEEPLNVSGAEVAQRMLSSNGMSTFEKTS